MQTQYKIFDEMYQDPTPQEEKAAAAIYGKLSFHFDTDWHTNVISVEIEGTVYTFTVNEAV